MTADPHARALYAAEHGALDPVSRRFADVREARAFLDDVIADDWFARRWPEQAGPLVDRRGHGAVWSLAQECDHPDGAILLAELDLATLLHELAHHCRGVSGGHDDRYLATFLVLVRRFMGVEAYGALRSAAETAGRWPFLDDELAPLL